LVGEAAIAVPLHDPRGLFAGLQARASVYPDAMRDALLKRFRWEVDFAIDNGRLAVARGDGTHVAGCAYRVLCCAAQVLFALNRQWLINEKGAIQATAALKMTIPDLAVLADDVWGDIGNKHYDAALTRLSNMSARLHQLTLDS
jgi:hypothetical protein